MSNERHYPLRRSFRVDGSRRDAAIEHLHRAADHRRWSRNVLGDPLSKMGHVWQVAWNVRCARTLRTGSPS